jgi:2-dehydro-3-deoxy-D-arabinonate dehydratase
LEVRRGTETIFAGEASTASMKRTLPELVDFLTCELDFPQGVFLMTGTCLVPEGGFTLKPEDLVRIQVGKLEIENKVQS